MVCPRTDTMWTGTLFALAAGLMWGLVFVGPLLLPEYPAALQSFGRYLAFGLIALPLAWLDRATLRTLTRADWIEAGKLALVGNIVYYLFLASAIQRAGGPLPTMIIGTLPVVIAAGIGGVLFHEACGHGLEADLVAKGASVFAGRQGEKVASSLVTVVDDGTIPSRRGSINVDDEGTPTGRTTLIEKGILKGYLQDKLNAGLMKMALTGNGRRESYAHIPMPRMTNTFMLAGDSAPEDILRSVKKGLYAVSFGGGQVDITSGKFVFSASEAYLIEDGKVTKPVKGATLIGNGPDVLTRVSMVGADLKLDEGVGTCGKDGQSVPVGVGMPTIKIDGLTVGGTRA
mgnify:CR=1 FL=1